MSKSPLERLIEIDTAVSSEDRRDVLRDVTDTFMVAPDRYGRRDMSLFDLLLSRTASAMDERLRRVLALALVRSGARDEVVRFALTETPSPNGRFLRRSVMQTRQDILAFLQEESDDAAIDGDHTFADGNTLTLPALICHWLFQYQSTFYRKALSLKIGPDRSETLARAIERCRDKIVEDALVVAREEIVVARRTVKDWGRRQAITEDILAELLEARAMTEFIFALVGVFEFDTATTIRVLNDTSFESLAIAAKASDIRRSVFAKTILGFRQRKTDKTQTDRILSLYDKLPNEAAERAMRFWRVRVMELSAADTNEQMAHAATG
ncbi:MAG: DUF2336 domain-containing protein [Pseudomonadota bacterium]